jgi:hypothetical protein
MDAQELRSLQEAYMEVYEEIDEGIQDFLKQKVAKIQREITKLSWC